MMLESVLQTINNLFYVQNGSYMVFSIAPWQSDTSWYSATSSKATCRRSLPLGFIGTAISSNPCFNCFASQGKATQLFTLWPDWGLKSPQHRSQSPYQLSPDRQGSCWPQKQTCRKSFMCLEEKTILIWKEARGWGKRQASFSERFSMIPEMN